MPPKVMRAVSGSTSCNNSREQRTTSQAHAVSDAERLTVLRSIRNMQDSGIPSFTIAMKEIKRGRKTSHWIWYVWPSLKALRPGTSRPFFLLPDFETARLYIADDVLRERFHDCTQLAVAHLQRGVQAKVLFSCTTDVSKVEECVSTFALAAAENLDLDTLDLCIEALEALPCHGCLTSRVLDILNGAHRFAGITLAKDLRVAVGSVGAECLAQFSLENDELQLESRLTRFS